MEGDGREHHEHHQSDHLLQYLELHEREGAAIALKTDAVGRHLQAIFKERNAPRNGYHTYQRERFEPRKLRHLKMAIPCERHKHVGRYQK